MCLVVAAKSSAPALPRFACFSSSHTASVPAVPAVARLRASNTLMMLQSDSAARYPNECPALSRTAVEVAGSGRGCQKCGWWKTRSSCRPREREMPRSVCRRSNSISKWGRMDSSVAMLGKATTKWWCCRCCCCFNNRVSIEWLGYAMAAAGRP